MALMVRRSMAARKPSRCNTVGPTCIEGQCGLPFDTGRRRAGGLEAFDQGAGAETAAAAHRDEAVGAVDSLELVERGGDEPGAGAADGVTDRDGAAVGV